MKYIYSPLLSTWVLLDLASPPCDLYFDAAKKSLFEHCILSAAGSYDLPMWQNGNFYSVRYLNTKYSTKYNTDQTFLMIFAYSKAN